MYVSQLNIIGSDNELSLGRRQAFIWADAGILIIRTLGTNFSEILSEIRTFSFKEMHFKISSGKWQPFCLGLSVLTHLPLDKMDVIFHTIFSDAFTWMKSVVSNGSNWKLTQHSFT